MIVKFSVDSPVSINALQGRGGGRTYNTKEYKAFKENVLLLVKGFKFEMPIKGQLYCKVYFTPKDKRKRDLDNFSFKGLFDALTQAEMIDDDSSFKLLFAFKNDCEKIKYNKLDVEIGYLEDFKL